MPRLLIQEVPQGVLVMATGRAEVITTGVVETPEVDLTKEEVEEGGQEVKEAREAKEVIEGAGLRLMQETGTEAVELK